MKINTAVTVSFVLVALLSTLIGSYIAYDRGLERSENQIATQFLTIAESRAEHIETYFLQNIESLKLINSRTKLRNELKTYYSDKNPNHIMTLNQLLNDSKKSADKLNRLCIFDLEGNVISSTNSEYIGRNAVDEDFFIKGLTQEGVYFKFEEGAYKILISGPITLNGEVLGVGVSVINMDYLESIVSSRTGLGETGEILIAIKKDNEIVFLTERLFESELVEHNQTFSNLAEPMQEALKGNERFFKSTLDYRGETVIAISQYIDQGKIGLVTKRDVSEIINPIKQEILSMALTIVLFVIVVFMIIGFFVSKIITRPINKLSKQVNSITKGNLHVHLEKSNLSEIEVLSNSLSRIMASMKLPILPSGISKEAFGIGEEEIIKMEKETENKLHMSQSELKKYLDISLGLIVAIDKDGRINMINKNGAKTLGYGSPEDLIGKDWFETCIPENSKKRVRKHSNEVLKNRHKLFTNYKNEVLSKDGSVIWTQWNSEVLRNSKGEVIGHLSSGIVVDNKYEDIFKHSNEGVLLVDIERKKFLDVNPEGLKMFKIKSKKDFLKIGPKNLSPQKQPDGELSSKKATEMIEKAVKEGKNMFEWVHKKSNGQKFLACVSLSKYIYKGRDVILAVVRDLSAVSCNRMSKNEKEKLTKINKKKVVKKTTKKR